MVQKFSGVKVNLWHWLEENIGNQDGTFELNQSKLADKFDVSRTAIINALKTFVSANLMEKVSSGRGRGNHSEYKLLWTFKQKNVTPSCINKENPKKLITKGRRWRYFAYKFRMLVEDSSLANRAQTIVGKILNFLEGKPPDLAHRWLQRLKHWLSGEPADKSLKDFFVFFHNGLMEIAQSQVELERTEQRIKEQRVQREQVRNQYDNNPPPKSSNFARFSNYLEAMDEWES